MKTLNQLSKKIIAAVITLGACSLSLTGAEKIGSFVLDKQKDKAGQYTQLTLKTKSIASAPVELDITLSAHGQREAGDEGMTVHIFSMDTHFIEICRFGGKTEVGALQYNIKLKDLEEHLINTGKSLENLSIQLFTESDKDYPYDIYISYSAVEDNITLTGLDLSPHAPSKNYEQFFLPAQSAEANDIVDGRFAIYKKGLTNKQESTIDITNLYNHNIRELNVIFISNAYGAGNRRIRINGDSGVFLETK